MLHLDLIFRFIEEVVFKQMIGWHRFEPDPPVKLKVPFQTDRIESFGEISMYVRMQSYFNKWLILILGEESYIIFNLVDQNNSWFNLTCTTA